MDEKYTGNDSDSDAPPEPELPRQAPHQRSPPTWNAQAAQFAAWLACPVLFVAFCWTTLLAPGTVARWLPRPRHSWLLGGPTARDAAPSLVPFLSIAKSPTK